MSGTSFIKQNIELMQSKKVFNALRPEKMAGMARPTESQVSRRFAGYGEAVGSSRMLELQDCFGGDIHHAVEGAFGPFPGFGVDFDLVG